MTASNVPLRTQAAARLPSCVHLIEPDERNRQDLESLFTSVSLQVQTFADPTEFLNVARPGSRGCVVMNVRLPGMTGLQLQQMLLQRQIYLPLIMLTSDADLRTAVEALKRGAFDFLEKGCSSQLLLERVFQSIELDASRSAHRRRVSAIRERLAMLTHRERQIVELLIQGKTTKQAALELRLSAKTVENHRARIMEKTQADTFAMLISHVWQGANGCLANLDKELHPAPWIARWAV